MCGAPDCRSCGKAMGSMKCVQCGRLACDEHEQEETVCAGCGEPAEKNEAGDSVCCQENFMTYDIEPRDDGPDPDDAADAAWDAQCDRMDREKAEAGRGE